MLICSVCCFFLQHCIFMKIFLVKKVFCKSKFVKIIFVKFAVVKVICNVMWCIFVFSWPMLCELCISVTSKIECCKSFLALGVHFWVNDTFWNTYLCILCKKTIKNIVISDLLFLLQKRSRRQMEKRCNGFWFWQQLLAINYFTSTDFFTFNHCSYYWPITFGLLRFDT